MLVDWSYGHVVAAEVEEKNASPIPLAELRYVLQKIDAPDIDTLTKTEYIVLELVRLGKLSLDDINVYIANFATADKSKTGFLSIDEMVACGMVFVNPNYEEREAIYGLTPRGSKTSIRLNELVSSDTEPLGGDSPC